MSNSTTFDDDGFTSNNIGLTGTAGSRDQFNYGVNVSHQRQDSETTAGTNLTRNTPVATLNGSYSQSSNYTQTGGSISGGVVARSGGLNLSSRLSDTFAIMQAPGLEGAYVNGQKYRTTNKKERWFMTTLRHIAKTILCLMCRKVAVKRNYAVTVKLPPRTEGPSC